MADHHTPAPAPAPATDTAHPLPTHGHGAEHGHGDYWLHVRPYLLVGMALFLFTALTVALSYVDFDRMLGGHDNNMKIGLGVAAFKVCLVGAWFMHLKQEKGTIWRPLLFTFFFCLGLFLLTFLAHSDPIQTTSHPLH
ncbi:MAG: cytochrome C oxidase subunit IV family protein [Chthoniobacteraceae bacterium]